MGARILQFSGPRSSSQSSAAHIAGNQSYAAPRTAALPLAHSVSQATPQADTVEHFQFWRGASDSRYVHTVYDLFECPDLPQANVMLVRRNENGRRAVLHIGRTRHNTGSLNLAEVRQRAASLGANEVHVHLLPSSDNARQLAEFDLRAGIFSSLSARPQ